MILQDMGHMILTDGNEWPCDLFEKAELDESLIVDQNVTFFLAVAPADGKFEEMEAAFFKFKRP